MTIEIEQATSATPEIAGLLEELNAALAGYTAEQRHALSIHQLFRPGIRFFLARSNGEAVACGGVAFFEGYAEVKRMYSRQAVRGKGVAKAILRRLEAEARATGLPLLRLETGIHQKDALKFYEAMGFRPCAAFGAYLAMPAHTIATSLFYEKPL
jgi:putative acetyltransferase